MRRSFRGRLTGAFLLVSLVPMLICSALLLQIFRLRMTNSAETESEEYLSNVSQALDAAWEGFLGAAEALEREPLVTRSLAGESGEDTLVYSKLFDATEGLRAYARFDLYDSGGGWRYSTQNAPEEETLSTSWGVLHAAREADGLTFLACEDVTEIEAPLLQGAAVLRRYGEPVGYLLISMYQAGFRRLLDGKFGTQNDLILLSRYWRPVYCAQPTLAASLAPRLRAKLLAGEALEGASEDFLCRISFHEPTGLYLVLHRPQVFTRGTMGQLYTVSLTCALICVAISALMSLKVGRQMSRPIEQLHRGIGEVAHNNLDVTVPPGGDDELGELAERFNGMVSALKRSQEALVENQRELNQAQIRMLQAQLNPHFLCNTLDTMKWISKINRVPQVALMSTDLADILRFCVSPEELVPLRREAEILERYIEIQKIRLSGAFTYRMDLPEELADCLVPKMVLQPIVENAILHGLDGVENGEIRVTARESEGLLTVTVEDNGRGLPPELTGACARRGRERSQGRLGLYNVDTILVKYYGAGFGLHLDNKRDGPGAVVTATLPARREEERPC